MVGVMNVESVAAVCSSVRMKTNGNLILCTCLFFVLRAPDPIICSAVTEKSGEWSYNY